MAASVHGASRVAGLVLGSGGGVTKLCLTCDSMECSLVDSSVHGILQANMLEWIAISFSKGSSQPRNRTQVSCIAFFTDELRELGVTPI